MLRMGAQFINRIWPDNLAGIAIDPSLTPRQCRRAKAEFAPIDLAGQLLDEHAVFDADDARAAEQRGDVHRAGAGEHAAQLHIVEVARDGEVEVARRIGRYTVVRNQVDAPGDRTDILVTRDAFA